MKLEVLNDADSVARRGAELIAGEARAAVTARGCFTVAVSGGRTPWAMLRALRRVTGLMSRGRASTSCRWTNAWRPRVTRIGT